MTVRKPVFTMDDGALQEFRSGDVLPVSSLPEMGGATTGLAGSAGIVPAPQAGDEGKVLMGNKTWAAIPVGAGIPAGGSTGQVLAKNSNTDYDAGWVAQTGGGSSTPSDTDFRIRDNADNTKQIAFEASGIATGTMRTIAMPNQDVSLTPGTTFAGSGHNHSGVYQPIATVLTNTTASFTTAQETKLAGVAAGANNYSHPNHTGEVTSTGDGAMVIENDAVTYAKMQNVSATDKVLGRLTAGSGDVEEITCTAFGRSLIDDATVADAQTTLKLNNAVSVAQSGAAITLDLSLGNCFVTNLTANITTVIFTNPPTSGKMREITWIVTQTIAGQYSITWPSTGDTTIVWSNATPPSNITTNNVYKFITENNATPWVWKASQQYADVPVKATGGTVTDSGSYRTHTFTSNGTFTVLQTMTADYLLVGGGGGGGGAQGPCGGGGAGGFLELTSQTLGIATYAVVIGAGGSGGPNGSPGTGSNGGVTSFIGGAVSKTVSGGGGGGSPWISAGLNGASGGGGGASGGVGGTSTVSAPELGNAGGAGITDGVTYANGGGGGGAGGVGGTAIPQRGGHGGSGNTSNFTGLPLAGGGGGGGDSRRPATQAMSTGGSGVGGVGSNGIAAPATSGIVNTGSGGGGSAYILGGSGGNGGSGVVIIRYLKV